MKLCRDCKHSVWPHSLAQLYGQATYPIPMCGHPEARRSLVNGDLLDTCAGAREDADYMKLAEPGCGRDARRFEERPPPEPSSHESDSRPYQVVMTFEREYVPGFWERIAGCIFGG